MTTATDTILQPLLASDPAAPLVTHYDVAAGSRVELSAVTTTNWAAKIAGLWRDELDVQPGDAVAIDTSTHWLCAGLVLGTWWCGAQVVTGGDLADQATVTVASPDRLDAHANADELVVMTTDPMGRPAAASGWDIPVGITDLTESCRIHPDAFTPGTGGRNVLDGTALDELVDPALAGRILVVNPGENIVPVLASIFASGGSVVLVTSVGDDETGLAEIDRIAATENTTGRI